MIVIYESNATDFTNNGLGTLEPISCVVTETINGNYEVVFTHPIDEKGKFSRIQEERIIKVPVPAGKTPYMHVSGGGEAAREIYRVDTGGERLHLRNGASLDAKIIGKYAPGTEIVVIDRTTNSKWSEVTTPDGKHGWMWTGNLEYVRTEMTGEAAEESTREPMTLRDQPFRIYKVEPTLTGITAYARHIFYDLMDNMVASYTPNADTTGANAFMGLAGATEDEHGFTFYSDLDGTAENVEIIDKNPAEAILDDGGLIENYGGELMRDWWDVYLAKRIGEETDIQIREGKNLLGIKYSIDTTNAVTRVIPKGEDEDGNPLYLPGRYRENEAADRPAYVNRKYGMLEVKEAKVKTKGEDKRTEAECIELMEKAAKEAFEAGCDLPDVTLNVNFIDCAETEEYRQYRNLQGIHMGDTVRVIAKRVGVEVAMRMTQYSYDCLTKKYTKMTLGTIDATIEGNMINPRSIGSGTIRGSMIKLNSIGTGQIMDGAVNSLKIALAAIDYAHIGTAAIDQLAVNAVTAIRADIRELVAGNITTDQLYADLAVIAAAQITAANIEKANIQWAEIENLAAEIAKVVNAEIAKAEIDWAQIKNAEIDAADITNLTAAVATIVKAEIALAEIDWANIKNVEVGTADIKLGAITQALIAAGAIGTAQIADGSITSAKIVELTADLIKTGTLSAERLLIKGAGGLFYEINATAGGLTAAQLTEEQYKNAISGTALVARSVTADKIAAKSITSNEILSGTITAAEIDVANLFAAEATIAALDSYIMRTTTIEALKGSLDIWAEDKIALRVKDKADQSDLEALDKRLENAESTLTVQAESISANATRIETVNQTAANAQSTANSANTAASNAQSTANSAQNKANENAEDLDAVAKRVTTAEANISALDGKIGAKVEQSEFDALGKRVSAAEGELLVQANEISAEVARATEAEENLSGRISVQEDKIELAVNRTVGGTNLAAFGQLAFANSAGTLTGAVEEREEAHYCRSGRALRLKAFDGSYNLAGFHGISLAEGKEYTVSFWAAGEIDGTPVTVNIWNSGRGVDMGLGEVVQAGPSGGYYTRTFTCPTSDVYWLRFIIFGAHAGYADIMDVKLEEGNTATAWSAHPEEFRAGSGVEITEKRVKISAPETLIAIPSEDGEATVAQFDENGLTAERVISGNLAYRYDGPSVLYVDANATDEQMKTGGYYRSLADACAAVSGKNIDQEIAINILSGTYGESRLTGICGTGSIAVNGNQNGLTGKLYIGKNTVDITLWGLTVTGTGSAAVEQTGPGWVQWSECTFIGNSAAGSYGLMMARKASAFLYSCGFYNAEHLLGVGTSADVVCNTLKGGGGTNFLYGDGGNVKWYGTRPDGNLRTDHPALYAPGDLAALAVDYGTAQPSTPAIQTAEFVYLYSDSYRGGWSWFSDEDIRQGYISSGAIYGVMWFDAADIRGKLSGRTINQVSLRLHMHKGVGRGSAVSVELYGTNTAYDGRSGAPALATSYGTIGTTEPDAVSEITIPAQVIQDIVSGTIQALVLKSGDDELYKDRDYSRNYARFSGSTTATAENQPRLTVVYQ